MIKKIGVGLVVIGTVFFMSALGFVIYGLTLDGFDFIPFGKASIALLTSIFVISAGMHLIFEYE